MGKCASSIPAEQTTVVPFSRSTKIHYPNSTPKRHSSETKSKKSSTWGTTDLDHTANANESLSIKSSANNGIIRKVSTTNTWSNPTFTAHTGHTTTKSTNSKSIKPVRTAQWRLDLEYGSKLDIYDNTYSKWYPGKVTHVKNQANTTMQIKIRYDGYGSKYDEYIDVTSKRLAPLHTHTTEHKKSEISIPTNKSSSYYKSINFVKLMSFGT